VKDTEIHHVLQYFLVAAAQPRYNNYIHDQGKLSPANASLLSAIFAKAIELTFVTVFTSIIGQLLSRRALNKGSKGVSIADMQMKQWVYQPGSVFASFARFKYAAPTILGFISLWVVIFATFYTTGAYQEYQTR
jgi:hypothetical protein